MNFLAHIFLSGDDDLLKIGNFMADGIRGNNYLEYPEKIQKGVVLHGPLTLIQMHTQFGDKANTDCMNDTDIIRV